MVIMGFSPSFLRFLAARLLLLLLLCPLVPAGDSGVGCCASGGWLPFMAVVLLSRVLAQ